VQLLDYVVQEKFTTQPIPSCNKKPKRLSLSDLLPPHIYPRTNTVSGRLADKLIHGGFVATGQFIE